MTTKKRLMMTLAVFLASALMLSSTLAAEASQPEGSERESVAVLLTIEEAEEIAFTASAIESGDIYEIKATLDADDGRLTYEIEFETYVGEFEFEIDAVSGEILNQDTDSEKVRVFHKPDLSIDEAKRVAYEETGFDVAQVVSVEIELDRARGAYNYEVELKTKDDSQKLEVHAYSGEVIRRDLNFARDRELPMPSISNADALSLAYQAFELETSDAIYELDLELKMEDRSYYEIDFKTSEAEYEIEIDAETGDVIAQHVEHDERSEDTRGVFFERHVDAALTLEAAYEMALSDAAFADDEFIYELDLEFEDDEPLYYDIKIETTRGEYDYEIDAETGEILKREVRDFDNDPATSRDGGFTYLKALEIALDDTKLDVRDVYKLDIEFESDRMRYVKVELHAYHVEYSLEIDQQGGILKREQDLEDESPLTVEISIVEAIERALTDVGLQAEDIREVDIELEYDDDLTYYEIELKTAARDYQLEMHADTGDILDRE